MLLEFLSSFKSSLVSKLIFLPINKKTIIETVITPSPPNWIKNKIINCPVGVKTWLTSTTDKPVTQIAETIVNKESKTVIF